MPKMKRAALAALLLLLPAEPLFAQVATEADGAAAMGVMLRRLGTSKRVLMIAAHPDDENTAVIAELGLGHGADVAYLSLTRGEGGQNLIGPELQEGLGLIRSEELLAARRLDGAQQFFSRAYDYGFSKSADEAFRQWPQDTLLADVVEVIRRYRPDVLIAVFGGTPADGHGQHQASGIVARAAFTAAADPARFPAQLARGLRPHAPRYLFQAQYRPGPNPPLRLSTGDLDPLFARSRYQIAMQSRSRHRSQDMGRAAPIGPQTSALVVLAGELPAGAASLFAGIDTTLSQRARRAGAAAPLVAALTQYEETVAALRTRYNPLRMHDVAPPLASALRSLRALSLPAGAAFEALRDALRHEISDLSDALRQSSGVVIDVVADTPYPVPGESFALTVSVWNGGRAPVRLQQIEPRLPAAWTYQAQVASDDDSGADTLLAPNAVVRRTFRVNVPADATPTEAYFLRAPRAGALYRWEMADSLRALPFAPADVRAAVAYDAGAALHVEREAEYVDVDKAVGEVRRPLLIVPRVSVALEPRIAVMPTGEIAPRAVFVTLTAAAPVGATGTLRLRAPSGWQVEPASLPVQLTRAGESQTFAFAVTPPANTNGQELLQARYETADGSIYDRGYTIIHYPHIRPQPLYRAAEARITRVNAAVAPDLRIGYIEGAGDDGAAALRQLGARVDPIDAAMLANGDLSRFDVIVAGIRAYEVRPDLLAHNDRVLAFVRAGGTYIVQYNKYELVQGGFMPYRATMAQPHGRVTDETAPVTLLAPEHPLLRFPNRITAADFDDWVQERGLYFLDQWDERYTPLLAMADPGEAPQRGSLVAARVGSGWYVYTGLALFRQLAEGVPGAYRLLANLVSLGKAPLIP